MFEFLFPKKCVGCKKIGKYFCNKCVNKIQYRRGVIKPYELEGLVSGFVYKGMIKKAIKKFKFKYVTDLFDELMELFEKEFIKNEELIREWKEQKYVIVPVPLHKKRLNWRGFNQSQEIGRRLFEILKIEMNNNFLKRIKNTKAQSEIKDVEARKSNIKKAFGVQGKPPERVLLVDDVWTTGSTMKECAKVLRAGGVKKIWGVTVAH